MLKIEKSVQIDAPQSRVWRALTDYQEFGKWFLVKIDGPFVEGQLSTGHTTYPGFEHVKWQSTIQKMEPESYFSYSWHPFAVEADVDYTQETPTLVEFRLESKDGGTLLTVTETGFENVPAHRRDEALRMNTGGWEEQLNNVKKHSEA